MGTVLAARDNSRPVSLYTKGGHGHNQRWPGAAGQLNNPPVFHPQPHEGTRWKYPVPWGLLLLEDLCLLQWASTLVGKLVFFFTQINYFLILYELFFPLLRAVVVNPSVSCNLLRAISHGCAVIGSEGFCKELINKVQTRINFLTVSKSQLFWTYSSSSGPKAFLAGAPVPREMGGGGQTGPWHMSYLLCAHSCFS